MKVPKEGVNIGSIFIDIDIKDKKKVYYLLMSAAIKDQ